MPVTPYYLGDVVKLKKGHPCGSNEWEIVRVGMDFRLKCCGCGRLVMLPRRDFEKAVRAVLKRTAQPEKSAEKTPEA